MKKEERDSFSPAMENRFNALHHDREEKKEGKEEKMETNKKTLRSTGRRGGKHAKRGQEPTLFSRNSIHFFFYSLFFHVALFGYFVFDPFSNLFPKENVQIKNAIRVDTVNLPKLRNKKETSPQQMKSRVKQAEKKRKPVKKQIKKQPAKTVKVKKPSLKKNISTIKQEQNQAMSKIKELKNIEREQSHAIDQLSAMENLQNTPEKSKKPVSEKNSKEISQDKDVAIDFQTLQYFTSLRAHIKMHWNLPYELADKNLRATIYVELNDEGKVLVGQIIKSSGNEDFDVRVLETIERASPFPRPSTIEIKKKLSEGIAFNFPE